MRELSGLAERVRLHDSVVFGNRVPACMKGYNTKMTMRKRPHRHIVWLLYFCQRIFAVSDYFTTITKYLLVDQNNWGLVMRSTYMLLASRSSV